MKNNFAKYVNKKTAMFLAVLFFAWLNLSWAQEDGLNVFEDRDRDGLADVEELALGTDPNKADTDGDGYNDGVEVASGYDPLVPAPGDRIVDDAAVQDDQTVTVNLTKQLLENLQAEKFDELEVLKAASLSEEGIVTTDGEEASLTEAELESLITDTLQQGGVQEDEMELIDEEEFEILDAPKGDDEDILEQEKRQVEAYFIEVGYILTENFDYISGSQDALSSDLLSLIMEVGMDIDEGDDSLVGELKGDGGDVLEKLKNVQVPYVLKDVHITGVSLLGYMLNQNEGIVFNQEDPAAIGLMVGKLEGAMMEMNELGLQVDQMFNKYNIETLDINSYQEQLESMY